MQAIISSDSLLRTDNVVPDVGKIKNANNGEQAVVITILIQLMSIQNLHIH